MKLNAAKWGYLGQVSSLLRSPSRTLRVEGRKIYVPAFFSFGMFDTRCETPNLLIVFNSECSC